MFWKFRQRREERMGVILRILLWYLYFSAPKKQSRHALWLSTFMDYVVKVWWNYLVRKRLLELHSKAELMRSSGLEALRFPNWLEWLFSPFCLEPVNSVCFVFVSPSLQQLIQNFTIHESKLYLRPSLLRIHQFVSFQDRQKSVESLPPVVPDLACNGPFMGRQVGNLNTTTHWLY